MDFNDLHCVLFLSDFIIRIMGSIFAQEHSSVYRTRSLLLEHFASCPHNLSDEEVEYWKIRHVCKVKQIQFWNKLIFKFSSQNNLLNEDKEEFFDFLESLANATYVNFQNIKSSKRIDEILDRLSIEPKNYLSLIYELTEDLTKTEGTLEFKVRNVNNLEFIQVFQILTEYGICYSTNNYLAINLSTSLLLEKKMPTDDPYYKKVKLHRVRYGNLFDGEVTFSFIGFRTAITTFMHSPYETMNVARPVGSGYSHDAFEFETLSIEIITTSDFKETFVEQRGCRFHSESNLTHFSVYSKNLCMSECRLELAYRLCKCIPHFYFNEREI